MMRRSAALTLVAGLCLTAPAMAEDKTPALPEIEDLERGAEEAVANLLALVGPMIERFSAFVDDLPAYEAPVVLPNGDILIRRKEENLLAPGPDATETEI